MFCFYFVLFLGPNIRKKNHMFRYFSAIIHRLSYYSFPFHAMIFLMAIWISSCSPARRTSDHISRMATREFYQEHSRKLGFHLSGKENPALIAEVSSWMGSPYRHGGFTRQGADCSGFVWQVYRQVYGYSVPRTTDAMASVSRKVRPRRLKEGDLVFFRINKGRKVSHVGIYLGQDKFIHASTYRGVIVSDLNEYYYARRIVYGGRIRGIR